MSDLVKRGVDLLPADLKPKEADTVPVPPLVTEEAVKMITSALVNEVKKAITPIKQKADDAYNLAVNALPKTGGLITGNLNIKGELKATGNIGGNEPAAGVAPTAVRVQALTNEEILSEINRLKSEIAYLETMLTDK